MDNDLKTINVGSFNVRGCIGEYQQQTLINDIERYRIQICGIQETHLNGNGIFQIKPNIENSKNNYVFYHVNEDINSHHGVGLIVNKQLNPSFKKISDRICQAKIKLKDKDLYVFSVYADTLSNSEKDPDRIFINNLTKL